MMTMRKMREEDEVDDNGDEKRAVCVVNTTLLPLKVLNFFYFGAVGSVIPFLTVYLQYLRLTAPETGVVTGVAVLLAFLVRPLLGVLADCTGARRLLLGLCCLVFGAAFCSLWFVPQRTFSRPQFVGLNCGPSVPDDVCSADLFNTSDLQCSLCPAQQRCWLLHNRGALRNSEKHSLLFTVANTSSGSFQDWISSDLAVELTVQSNGRLTLVYYQKLATELLQRSTNDSVWEGDLVCLTGRRPLRDKEDFLFDTPPVTAPVMVLYKTATSHLQEKTNESNSDNEHGGVLFESGVHKPNYRQSFPNQTNPATNLTCHLTCLRDDPEISPPAFTFDFIFYLILILISVARAIYASANSLLDTVTYSLLGSNRHQWGRQRLWGTIGTAVAALIFTSINDRIAGEGFSALFVTCCCLTLLACATQVFLKLPEDITPATANNNNSDDNNSGQQRPKIIKKLSTLFGEAAVKIFLVKILVLGIFCGTAQNFIFWFLRELGSNQTVLGACLLANCFSTVVVLRLAAVIIGRLGETRSMYLAFPAYVIRFVAISVLEQPWLAVPLELLHGVTYSLLWAAASASTQLLAPPSTHATCQAIAGALYWDMGRGVGSLMTGQLFRAMGARWTLRSYGLVAAAMLPVCVLLDKRWPLRQERTRAEKDKTVTSVNDDDAEGQPSQHLLTLTTTTTPSAALPQCAPVTVVPVSVPVLTSSVSGAGPETDHVTVAALPNGEGVNTS